MPTLRIAERIAMSVEVITGNCLEVMSAMPAMSVDLVFGSPPYCDARTYQDDTLPEGHVVSRHVIDWVDWMLDVTTEAVRVSRGAVIWVAAGVTRKRNYWPACEGLMWEWHKRGGHMYRPCYWHRVGVPGSGGDQWFRSDVEYVMCFKREGKLPWTDNTAMGHPPKWAAGGEMSYRNSDGTRRNQWGHSGTGNASRRKNGSRDKSVRKSHRFSTNSDQREIQSYEPPKLANPGNLIQVKVGGGVMGDALCHENEAPFPEKLAEWFVRSLCPPGGTVLDPFMGSGTTAKVASVLDRNAIGIDVRQSQVDLTRRRLDQCSDTKRLF